MKSIVTLIAAASLLAAPAIAQPPRRYIVKDLGTLPGGTFSQATFVNNKGLVTGVAIAPDGKQHAVLWQGGRIMDIATPGLGGPNSVPFVVNERGQAVGQAESSTKDPNSENFCGYGTGLNCLPVLWQDGVMTQLPMTLGGNNGSASAINNRGEVAGIEENSTRDPKCAPGVAVNGTGPQVLDYEAVIWGPKPGEKRTLLPLNYGQVNGDTVGMAFWINDNGQVAGSSGSCATTVLPPFVAGEHAVLWEKDGSVTSLGNLGGRINTASLGIGNHAFSINNRGQVVGLSALPGDTAGTPSTTIHAFLWTREKGIGCADTGLNGCMRDLGTLSGDVNSAGFSINDRGEVVGVSVDGSVATGNIRPFLWQNGVMKDLNTLILGDSPFLSLLYASGINDVGEIAGFGLQKSTCGDPSTCEVHAFLATPAGTTASAGPKNATVIARQITLDGTASFSADGKPLTYLWSIPQGSPSAAILHGTTATPEVQFASGRNAYIFQLTVTDSTGTSATEIVTVNFQGN